MLLDKMWDDVVAGPQPDRGLGKLRKISTKPVTIEGEGETSKFQRSISMPASPGTPSTPVTPTTPVSARKDNVWRSVFHPGSNLATKGLGAQLFDKPQPNSPTVYDWLYSGETRSKHR
ncbi:hypothetical protein P3X46_033246 [Hevea brasiliensis]|uniref:Auxin-repressed protein n=1 Tax=Hevea brasiliensis TaxID=3981 RepID=A0ABQ9KFR3_HEVBR|nr:auxin-repressed 12.5 kDa protein isoform X1 [Hevea brasiliensis]XP_021635068.1 auxin-repressed 12.5 kDa protein isoform X1 [Hevea brasiliensis]KAJ9136138.1 hypothetical protein P3X46_033246 [Hevea brasiliensis]